MKRWIGLSFVVGVLLGAGVMRSQQSATGTQRVVQFENDDVKVWKSIVVPHAPLTMHRHEHGRVIIALKGGTMKIVEQSGGSEAHVWEAGKAYWLPANAPGTMHADVCSNCHPFYTGKQKILDTGGRVARFQARYAKKTAK